MEFDLSAITGSVNKYLNAISDTNKLLTQKKSEEALSPDLSGLFEKYMDKAIMDEMQKKPEAIAEANPAPVSEPVNVRRVDTSIPFPKFDIGNMIADNIASHSRFNADIFPATEHVPQRENAAKGMDPFYTNMIRSSIFDIDNSGEDANA